MDFECSNSNNFLLVYSLKLNELYTDPGIICASVALFALLDEHVSVRIYQIHAVILV